MHYAVPQILHTSGVLEHFYTDVCANKGLPKLFCHLPKWARSARIQRLVGRTPIGIPPRQITAFTAFGLQYSRLLAKAQTGEQRNAAFLWAGKEFCRRIVKRGLGAANAVYTFNSAGLELLEHAAHTGIIGVTEQTIAPRFVEATLLARESNDFPDWEAKTDPTGTTEYCEREKAEWAAADFVVCASDFVRNSLVGCGVPINKIMVVPYGVDKRTGQRNIARECGPLRVLTVGAIGLRKGAPYVLQAAKLLKGVAHFRMVGSSHVSESAMKELLEHVEITGPLPRSCLHNQYDWADVFLLPSICEGSATVTYEALAHGLPVICTQNTGSVIEDGVDGFIVPIRDPGAIVKAVEAFLKEPECLQVMGENALRRSRAHTLLNYGAGLLTAFHQGGIVDNCSMDQILLSTARQLPLGRRLSEDQQ
jgi:glycosyltransferase involved in cell wall biosynthesis